MPYMTGLSGNEIYCLNLKELSAGELVIGNSVVFARLRRRDRRRPADAVRRRGRRRSRRSINEGRLQSFQRMMHEAQQQHGGSASPASPASCAACRATSNSCPSARACIAIPTAAQLGPFSTSGDGQELYCLLDAGYTPRQFVFGNVAYSIGIGAASSER